MFLKAWLLILPLVVHGQQSPTTSQVRWPSLKTTWRLFEDRPITRAAAIKAGWILMDACNGQWLGERYGLESDPSVVVLFDVAGYIAGMQNVILASAVNSTVNPSIAKWPFYQLGDFFGRAAYFTTAYFVDPNIICEQGRDKKAFQIQGAGDRLLFQNGPTPHQLVSVPLTQAAADADPAWFDHNCIPTMGDHYVQFGYNKDDSCGGLPVLLLYDQGNLHAFGFSHFAALPGPKWEHPTAAQLRVLGFPQLPTCLEELADNGLFSSMHIYFARLPSVVICPINPVLDSLGALTNSLLTAVPPKGKPFPKINGPKQNDKVCIVGAGPAGLHMAVSLKKKGVKNLVLFESSGRVGGKNMDVLFHEVAHSYMALGPSYFKTFLPLAKEYGSADLTQINWANVLLEGNKKATLQEYLIGSIVNITGIEPSSVIQRLIADAKIYDDVRKDMFGSIVDFLPHRPSKAVLYRLRGTVQDFLARERLESLTPMFKLLMSLPGYGYLDEIGALYGVLWVSPPAIMIFIDELIGLKRQPLTFYTLTDGFEQIWTNIVEKEKLDIRYNSKVESVVRSATGVNLGFWKEELVSSAAPLVDRGAVICDFLVWAAPAAQLNLALKQQSYNERHLLSAVQHNIQTTAWVNMKNDIRNGPLNAFQSTLDRKIENGVHYEISKEGWEVPGILARETVEAWDRNNSQTITKVVGCVAQKTSNERIVKENIVAHYTALNATNIEFLNIKAWKYFPRWSPELVNAGAHWDIFDMQGKGNMWLAGSSFVFESVFSVLEYNNLLIKQAGL